MDRKAKILVADDEKEIRQVLGMILAEEGYEVVTAGDGQEAARLASGDIDLYILDVNMPQMSGFAAGMETIMVHIKNIRKKLGDDSRNPRYIKTAWGKGYYAD